jgi:hypothetical protein
VNVDTDVFTALRDEVAALRRSHDEVVGLIVPIFTRALAEMPPELRLRAVPGTGHGRHSKPRGRLRPVR